VKDEGDGEEFEEEVGDEEEIESGGN